MRARYRIERGQQILVLDALRCRDVERFTHPGATVLFGLPLQFGPGHCMLPWHWPRCGFPKPWFEFSIRIALPEALRCFDLL